ncbi:MAG: hypothetical protein P4L57_15415 [Rhizomicrobium sp.]|nr:hypothetical protein [Rhizomicrobium sp.]
MSGSGVLTLAHSHMKYVRQARLLARSIRHAGSQMPLAVATDLAPALFQDLFDIVIPWKFDRWPGVLSKLDLAAFTPFETTLFIEADCLCLRPVETVFDYFAGQEFAVYGTNPSSLFWTAKPERYRTVVDAKAYPHFNGGLYYFRNTPLAWDVFERAKGFFEQYDALGVLCYRRKPNDEPLFSLAMASLGLKASDDPAMVVMSEPEPPAFAVDLDVLRGHCSFMRHGRRVEPAIIHFVDIRDRIAAYRREGLVLKLIVGKGWPVATRPLLALIANVMSFADWAMHRPGELVAHQVRRIFSKVRWRISKWVTSRR